MKSEQDQYIAAIESILSEIPALERSLENAKNPDHQKRVERSLKQRNKRFERMISFQFRMQLRNICREVGVEGRFLEANT